MTLWADQLRCPVSDSGRSRPSAVPSVLHAVTLGAACSWAHLVKAEESVHPSNLWPLHFTSTCIENGLSLELKATKISAVTVWLSCRSKHHKANFECFDYIQMNQHLCQTEKLELRNGFPRTNCNTIQLLNKITRNWLYIALIWQDASHQWQADGRPMKQRNRSQFRNGFEWQKLYAYFFASQTFFCIFVNVSTVFLLLLLEMVYLLYFQYISTRTNQD